MISCGTVSAIWVTLLPAPRRVARVTPQIALVPLAGDYQATVASRPKTEARVSRGGRRTERSYR